MPAHDFANGPQSLMQRNAGIASLARHYIRIRERKPDGSLICERRDGKGRECFIAAAYASRVAHVPVGAFVECDFRGNMPIRVSRLQAIDAGGYSNKSMRAA